MEEGSVGGKEGGGEEGRKNHSVGKLTRLASIDFWSKDEQMRQYLERRRAQVRLPLPPPPPPRTSLSQEKMEKMEERSGEGEKKEEDVDAPSTPHADVVGVSPTPPERQKILKGRYEGREGQDRAVLDVVNLYRSTTSLLE